MVKYMELVHIFIRTRDSIMENTKTISVKVMDAISMEMEEPISVNGKTESRMVRDTWCYQME